MLYESYLVIVHIKRTQSAATGIYAYWHSTEWIVYRISLKYFRANTECMNCVWWWIMFPLNHLWEWMMPGNPNTHGCKREISRIGPSNKVTKWMNFAFASSSFVFKSLATNYSSFVLFFEWGFGSLSCSFRSQQLKHCQCSQFVSN